MTAILCGQGGDKRRPPAGNEVVALVQRAKTGEQRVDEPQFLADPCHFMNVDIASEARGACEVTGIDTATSQPGGDVGGGVEQPNLRLRPYCQTIGADGHAHGTHKSVEGELGFALARTDNYQLARLIGRNEQGDLQVL